LTSANPSASASTISTALRIARIGSLAGRAIAAFVGPLVALRDRPRVRHDVARRLDDVLVRARSAKADDVAPRRPRLEDGAARRAHGLGDASVAREAFEVLDVSPAP